MTEPYPLPRHAAYIWAAGQNFHIAFPPTVEGGTRGNQVVLPLNERGLAVAIRVLQERSNRTEFQVGTPGSSTGHDLITAVESDEKYKAWLASLDGKKKADKVEKAAAEEFLKELGL